LGNWGIGEQTNYQIKMKSDELKKRTKDFECYDTKRGIAGTPVGKCELCGFRSATKKLLN